MKCNTFYEDQCCTSGFKSEGTKILNAPRMYRGRPLVKPIVITASDGYFIEILGPFLADGKNNDAGFAIRSI